MSAVLAGGSWKRSVTSVAPALIGLAMLASAAAGSFSEDFAADPFAHGWQVHGESNLFAWNPDRQSLTVTWDSEQPNSYCYQPLGTVVGMHDDFRAGFDLTLAEVTAGGAPGKPYTFQLAVGFFRQADALTPGFNRATAAASPNLVEWDYFPDTGLGATISPVIVGGRSRFIPSFNFPLELTPEVRYRIELAYTATNRTLATTLTADGLPFGPIKPVRLPDNFEGFQADAFGFLSYHSEGGDPRFLGSVWARGQVDNVELVTPAAPEFSITLTGAPDQPTVHIHTTRAGWRYWLESSADAAVWHTAGGPVSGTGADTAIADSRAQRESHPLYRVRAEPE